MQSRNSGFTLLELMITVAVIAILSAIAYPAYQKYVQDAQRTDAESNLLQLSQFMERYYTNNGRYTTSADGTTPPTLPFTKSPRDGSKTYYEISVTTTSAQKYTLSAAPEAGTLMADDDCGTLSVTQAGVKGATGDDVSDCWKN